MGRKMFVKILFDSMLGLSEFRFEVHTYPEDSPCEGKALCHVPKHAIGDIAFGEERDKGQYHPRHYHECGGHVLDPFFAVCCHRTNLLFNDLQGKGSQAFDPDKRQFNTVFSGLS
jgi:hypothetical protein